MLTAKKKKLISSQGYTEKDIENPDFENQVSWTPFSCAAFGAVGLGAGCALSFIFLCHNRHHRNLDKYRLVFHCPWHLNFNRDIRPQYL